MSLYVDIQKQFADFTLSVQLQAEDEIIGLLGESGSGKSMTLRCIAGIETPDRGKIVLNGRTLYDSEKNINLPARARDVGLMLQSYALFPNMTVAQNIGCGVKDRAQRKEIVQKHLNLLQLNGLEHRFPFQLSGGQQQRVALARMMASNPDLLMLDEPFSALDTHLRLSIEKEFQLALKEFKGTVLYVSHNMEEIYHFCKTTAVLKDGKITEYAKTQQLFDHPASLAGAKQFHFENLTELLPLESGSYSKSWGITIPTKGFAFAAIRKEDIALSALPNTSSVSANIIRITQHPRQVMFYLELMDSHAEVIAACDRLTADTLQNQIQGNELYLTFPKEHIVAIKE